MKKALVIGINYTNTEQELKGCIADATNIHKLLLQNEYNHKNVKLLTDNTAIKPTKFNIEQHLKWLFNNSVEGDTLFLYFSGHGSQVRDTNGDERDGKDEVLVPLDFKTKSVITDDFINKELSVVPKGVNVIAIFDCCHAGSILDLPFLIRQDAPNRFSFIRENNNDVKANVFCLSGCLDHQVSIEINGQGVMTSALLATYRPTNTLSILRNINNIVSKQSKQSVCLGLSRTKLIEKQFVL